ncbi:hypothetical protein Bbelb_385640 [Branchiostoma belcheri]|nr:hypothetical protein Bbelb_385640 [Branchiostoma belcheri]
MAPRVVVLSVTQCALGPSSLPGIVCQPKPPHACESSNTLVPRGSSVRTLTADPAGGWGVRVNHRPGKPSNISNIMSRIGCSTQVQGPAYVCWKYSDVVFRRLWWTGCIGIEHGQKLARNPVFGQQV